MINNCIYLTHSRVPVAPGLFLTGDSQSGILRIWNVNKPTPLENFQLKKKGFLSLAVLKTNANSNIIKYISNDNSFINHDSLNIKNTSSTNSSRQVNEQNYAIPNFKILASFSDGGNGLYDFAKKDWDFYKESGHLETIFDCKFSNNNNDLITTASFDGTIKLWSVSTAQMVFIFIISKIYRCL